MIWKVKIRNTRNFRVVKLGDKVSLKVLVWYTSHYSDYREAQQLFHLKPSAVTPTVPQSLVQIPVSASHIVSASDRLADSQLHTYRLINPSPPLKRERPR